MSLPEEPHVHTAPDGDRERLIQEMISLAQQGKIAEFRILFDRLRPMECPQDEYEVSPDNPLATVHGPVAEIWSPKEKIIEFKTTVPLTDDSPAWQLEMNRIFAGLRRSMKTGSHFTDHTGRTMPLLDMSLTDAMSEISNILLNQTQGNARVHRRSTVHLD